jgi:outer membrane lipoprotein carrier protein
MIFKFLRLLTLCFLLFPPAVFAGDSQEEIIQKLQSKMDSMSDWQANFKQKAYISSVGQSDLSSGTVKIKKPRKVLWEYLEPGRQVLSVDGKKLYFYTEEDRQVMARDLDSDALSGGNLLFLVGEKKLKDTFNMELIREETPTSESVKLKMVPKKEDAALSYLILTLDKKTLRILSLQSFDPFENNTMVEFSNVMENQGLPDKIFLFRIPEGVEVVHP